MIRVNAIVTLLFVVSVMLVGAAVYQQHQIVVNQRVQMKQQYHSDLVALARATDEDGFSRIFSEDTTEFSPKEQMLVALLIQRLIITKNIRPAFSDTEWQALVQEGKDAFTLPVFRTQWDRSKKRGFYDQETVSFVETTFFP